MEVFYKQNALDTLNEIANFIESKNTKVSGYRFIEKVFEFISDYSIPNIQYQLCKYSKFREKNFSCIFFHDWVIAFKIENEAFIVYEIVLGVTKIQSKILQHKSKTPFF
jgi:hypothetical protein